MVTTFVLVLTEAVTAGQTVSDPVSGNDNLYMQIIHR